LTRLVIIGNFTFDNVNEMAFTNCDGCLVSLSCHIVSLISCSFLIKAGQGQAID